MERVDCPICNGTTEGAAARITPFLLKYCNIKEAETETRYCRACDFAFFKRRLTDAEAKRIYTNYRGDEYNRVRLEVEPSYAHYIPLFGDELSTDYITRIRDHNDLLDVYPELDECKNVLDFGGDGTIPGRVFRNAQVWIDDLSAGSTDQSGRKHEFIFASNVFEHVSDPVTVARSLVQRLDPEGILFIDVPGPLHASLSEGLLWQGKHGGEMYVMHEHINYFAKRSLNRLVRAAGLVPVFEYRARHTAQSILAVFDGSDIARKLLPLREVRTLLYETKIARALALDAGESTWRATDTAASRVIATLADKVGSIADQTNAASDQLTRTLSDLLTRALSDQQAVATSRELALRQELEGVYRSTSWQVTAPVRAMKTIFLKVLRPRGRHP
jgi:hypothetical protein